MARKRRTLILTLPPEILGGVGAKAKLLADHLAAAGQEVTLAYYATRGQRPELCGPFRRPSARRETGFGGHSTVAVGCRLPEFEQNYSAQSPMWRELIAENDYHVGVGGTLAMANPLACSGIPHLVWCASDIIGDRQARQAAMVFPRRILDKLFVEPALLEQQRRVLNGAGLVAAVSPQSASVLEGIMGGADRRIACLPIPTDMQRFSPPPAAPRALTVGFAGRLADPRKNAGLLLGAMSRLRESGCDARLRATGEATPDLAASIRDAGLEDAVEFTGILEETDLPDFYRGLEVLAISSHQEGLAIVGIEAMACGVPVVSTRCGGPEAYVREGENGFLVGFDAAEMAERLGRILADSSLRDQMSRSSRDSVETEYGPDKFALRLSALWQSVWGDSI